MESLKRTDDKRDPVVVAGIGDDPDTRSDQIRCPLCDWRPSPSSLWSCVNEGTPEPPFPWCGTAWNTFTTAGRCPGCDHQWTWTSCLRCGGWSRHDDWYECA